MTELADRLKAARAARGLGQRDCSTQAGLSASYVSLLESGAILSPGADKLRSLADVLGVPTMWLAFGEGEDPFAGEAA